MSALKMWPMLCAVIYVLETLNRWQIWTVKTSINQFIYPSISLSRMRTTSGSLKWTLPTQIASYD